MTEKELKKKQHARLKRKKRTRAKINGTADRPRLSVFKSNKYFYAQVIDDDKAITLAAIDGVKEKLIANKANATELAKRFASTLQAKNINSVVFDSNGFAYHGVLESFANELRAQNIVF